MKRHLACITLALLWSACGGGEPPQNPPKGPSSVEEPPPPCEPEPIDERFFCFSYQASCGEILVKDSCGEVQTIDCGRCAEWETCREGVCVEEPEEIEGCLLVPEEGTCADLTRLERCVETEEGFHVIEEFCAPGEICEMGDAGPVCRPLPMECEGAISTCTADGNRLECIDGVLDEIPCFEGCSHSAETATCRWAPPDTVLHRATLLYEHHVPDSELLQWTLELRPAEGISVFSLSGDEILDGTKVGRDGSFEILVRDPPGPSDRIVFLARTSLLGGDTAQISVVDPGLPAGMNPVMEFDSAEPWSWTFENVRNEEFVIRVEDGSGAIQAFQGMYASVLHVASLRGPFVPSLRGIWAPGVDFSCGACYAHGWGVYLSGGNDETHRSDGTIFHETGHYAFHTLGVPAGEAGTHCLGVAAPPGQALVEGHATWYSADRRKDPRYISERSGTMFLIDIEKKQPSHGFFPPRRELGTDQEINEVWVSAVLWQLAKANRDSRVLHEALTKPELRAPLASGYIGKLWASVDHRCRPVNPISSGIPTPILSDYLDALLCSGFSEELVGRYVSGSYPYDPAEPTCK